VGKYFLSEIMRPVEYFHVDTHRAVYSKIWVTDKSCAIALSSQ
jgi:hypothetical protein